MDVLTRDEIIDFLIENDIDHTRHNIDAIEELCRKEFSNGYDEGYEQGRVDALIQGN